jgi:plastocyanin
VALSFIRRAIGAAICGTALALSFSGMPVVTVHGIARPPAAGSRWLTVDAKHHAVTLWLIASYTGANGGLNFNGSYNGTMVISVPVGHRVHVIFTSKGAYPHNAVVTATDPRKTTGTFSLAFRGSGPSDTASGVEALRFTFVASKVGTYYLVCGVPGHASAGMWDWFKVTRGGKPSLKDQLPAHRRTALLTVRDAAMWGEG